jgi:hypothetical protein
MEVVSLNIDSKVRTEFDPEVDGLRLGVYIVKFLLLLLGYFQNT